MNIEKFTYCIFFTVTKCLQTLRSVLQKDLAMQLLVKWYGARNAPGPQDCSPAQEWDLFLVVLFSLLGYDVEKLHLIQNNEKDQSAEPNNPTVLPKKQKTNNCGSMDDWLYIMNSSEYKNSQNFLSNVLKIQKASSFLPMIQSASESNNIGRINVQAALFPHFPLILFSLHLLYEELKLNSVISESLPLLGQLLYQLSIDLKFEGYTHHYFLDFPSLFYLKTVKSQISDSDLQKIIIPNYIPQKPPDIFETLDNILNGIDITTYPYLSHVNTRTRNVIYLTALMANENCINMIEMEKYVKLIIPAGSRVDLQESANKLDREIFKKLEKPTTDKIILLYNEMGKNLSLSLSFFLLFLKFYSQKYLILDMKKEDLKILPPAISLMIKDIMHRCRECPPPNWPMRAYELIDRQDLAALHKHLEPSSKLQYIDGETKDYGLKDEQDDGMEFDDTVYAIF